MALVLKLFTSWRRLWPTFPFIHFLTLNGFCFVPSLIYILNLFILFRPAENNFAFFPPPFLLNGLVGGAFTRCAGGFNALSLSHFISPWLISDGNWFSGLRKRLHIRELTWGSLRLSGNFDLSLSCCKFSGQFLNKKYI